MSCCGSNSPKQVSSGGSGGSCGTSRPQVPPPASSCCPGGGCANPVPHVPPPASAACHGGGCCPPPESRYPKPHAVARPDPALWAAAPPPAAPQFTGFAVEVSAGEPAPWTYEGEHLNALDFPLGGLGAGNAYLMGDGALGGFTVVNQIRQENQPMHCMPGCFFGASAEVNGQSQSFALISPQNYTDANAALPVHCAAHVSAAQVERLQVLPGIKGMSVRGTMPIADVTYDIPGFPVKLSMEAVTPLIPMETKDSSIPAAIFRFTAANSSGEDVKLRLLEAQQNFVGWDGQHDCTSGITPFWGGNVNTPTSSGKLQGLTMSSQGVAADSPDLGTLTIGAVAGAKVSVLAGAASETELWSQFMAGEGAAGVALEACPTCSGRKAPPTGPSQAGSSWVGGVVQSLTVRANGVASVSFVLAWHFPNRQTDRSNCVEWTPSILPKTIGNHYATIYKDATAAAQYVADNFDRLYGKTKTYRDTIFASTMDPYILDCAAGRIACATGPTMWRCADGTVLGTEGNGCCPLNCNHVYGYCTLLERLFPDLAKSMLHSNFVRNFDKTHGCTMRFGRGGFAIDGSLACVIKAYLTVRQADSTLQWLPQVWPNIKVQMEIVMRDFDGGDGVIRVAQQNTYDTAMLQANTFIGSYYVTALKSAAAMATLMGETELSSTYASRAEISTKAYEKICWREDFGYYIADVTEKDCQYSYGPGCFIDQLCAIGLSTAVGFGYMFDPAHEASARKAVALNNKVHMPPFHDLQKHFFPGDTGIRVCTYPHGKLGKGMQYEDLVSIGFTYPVVAGLLLDRNLEDAEEVAKHIRQRHDGRNRSPWNEPECGLLYSRAMAAWNLFDQAAGFRYDAGSAEFGFDPRYSPENFSCFFCAESGWGEFSQTGNAGLQKCTASLKVLHGSVKVASLQLATSASAVAVSGATAKISGGRIELDKPITVPEGSILTFTLSSPDDDAWCHIEEPQLQSF